MEHQFLTKFLTATLSRALSATTEHHNDLKVGADGHPLLIC